jgi:hypothetical protein
LPDVSASRYEAYVSGLPEAFYLKSVSVAGQETIDSGFDVNGTGRYRLDLVLSGDGAQVEGQVLDSNDKPAGGAMVALVPADAALRSASRLYKNATTAQDGKFALKSIPPGKYRIYAWEGIEDGAWYDPDFIGRYENQGESASFESGERKTMSLRLTSTTEGPSR